MEYKLFGNYLLEKIQKNLTADFLHNEAVEILRDHCNTWATCDGLSSKVIRKMIDRDNSHNQDNPNNQQFAIIVAGWCHSKHLWVQRSSCVSFVCLARHGHFNERIIDICSQCIQNQERFVQLGAGWVLRELSLADLNLVVDFIKLNYTSFSREGLRYAIEKMDSEMKQQLMRYDPNSGANQNESENSNSFYSGKSKKRKRRSSIGSNEEIKSIKKRKLKNQS